MTKSQLLSARPPVQSSGAPGRRRARVGPGAKQVRPAVRASRRARGGRCSDASRHQTFFGGREILKRRGRNVRPRAYARGALTKVGSLRAGAPGGGCRCGCSKDADRQRMPYHVVHLLVERERERDKELEIRIEIERERDADGTEDGCIDRQSSKWIQLCTCA